MEINLYGIPGVPKTNKEFIRTYHDLKEVLTSFYKYKEGPLRFK